jgi:UDP-3-O-[3-hydroxymyristoyl] glucosamine N-acyltransferase
MCFMIISDFSAVNTELDAVTIKARGLAKQLQTDQLLTVSDLLAVLDNAVVVGDPSTSLSALVHPKEARLETDMALILDKGALASLAHLPCHVIVAPKQVAQALGWPLDDVSPAVLANIPLPGQLKAVLLVERPRYALAALLTVFDKPVHCYSDIHPSAVIDATARIHPSASVGPLCVVGPQACIGANTCLVSHVTIGAGASVGDYGLLHSGVRIGDRVRLGNRVIIQPNATIGADGFSYATPDLSSIEAAKASVATGVQLNAQNTSIVRINSIGTVILEDDVEVGACTTIDRATLGCTIIKKGTKLDNLVMVGHNNSVGENCLIAGQSGIAGSCTIGNRVVMAGQVGIADHLTIGDDTIFMAQSGVNKSIDAKQVMFGTPALPWRETAQRTAGLGQLKEALREIRRLRADVLALQQAVRSGTVESSDSSGPIHAR